jgi:hypothetical protein
MGEKRFRALQTDRTTPGATQRAPHSEGVTDMTICTSSSIRTVTVGSGIAPDLLTPRERRRDRVARRKCGRSRARRLSPAYRRWGISPRPEDALIAGSTGGESIPQIGIGCSRDAPGQVSVFAYRHGRRRAR